MSCDGDQILQFRKVCCGVSSTDSPGLSAVFGRGAGIFSLVCFGGTEARRCGEQRAMKNETGWLLTGKISKRRV